MLLNKRLWAPNNIKLWVVRYMKQKVKGKVSFLDRALKKFKIFNSIAKKRRLKFFKNLKR